MGADNKEAMDDEYPKHKVTVSGFWIDETEVTNEQFERFVKATGYITTAERKPDWETLKRQLPPGTAKPDESLLIRAVTHQDPKLKMPMTGGKLKDSEIADLKYWIKIGAPWADSAADPKATSTAKHWLGPVVKRALCARGNSSGSTSLERQEGKIPPPERLAY